MDQLVQLRSLLKTRLTEKGVSFSYMPVLIKAVSLALHQYPVLNSTVDSECTTITYRADHNVSVAMDTPLGLIVPNVKRVQVRRCDNLKFVAYFDMYVHVYICISIMYTQIRCFGHHVHCTSFVFPCFNERNICNHVHVGV